MRNVVTSLISIVLTMSGFVSIYAQQCPPDTSNPPVQNPPSTECRLLGNGKGRFSQGENAISASMRLYIVGKPTDIYKPSYAMDPVIYRDVLIMSLGYYAPRKITPTTITLELTSYSHTAFKYESNHNVTIYIDDKPLLSKDSEIRGSMINIEKLINIEKFTIEIGYMDFLKFTEAKNITVQLGETKIKLKAEDIKALNELNKTTKELKFPPPSLIM